MTSNVPSPSEPLIAPDVTYHELFDDCDADITLQSKDRILFRVPSTVLQRTSSFFRSMLSLPQSQSPDPILPLDEEAWIVEPVLRMACGLPIIIDEVLDSFDTVEPILHFCDKYGMGGPLSIIQSAITRPRLLENPLRLYKLACRYDWPEARLAGWLCLKYDISHPDTIMRLGGLDLSDYSRLMDLALRRREKFEESLNDPQKFQGSRFVSSDRHGELFKTLVSSPEYACSKCHMIVHDLSWRVLRLVLLREIQRCPSGDTIRGEKWRWWPETIAVLGAAHCGKLLYDAEGTRANILHALDELPTDIV